MEFEIVEINSPLLDELQMFELCFYFSKTIREFIDKPENQEAFEKWMKEKNR